MCHQDIRDTVGFGKPFFKRDTRAGKLLAQPARKHDFAAHMPHRFRLGAPRALALLVREMKLRLLLRPAARIDHAPAIGAAQRLLARPRLRLFKRRLPGNHQRFLRSIRNQHNVSSSSLSIFW